MKQKDRTLRSSVLAVVLALLPPGPFTAAMIEKPLRSLYTRPEIVLMLAELEREEKVMVLKKLSGERLYHLPLPSLMEETASQFGLPEARDESLANLASNQRTNLVLDLLTILDQITRYEPELTRKGTLPKKLAEQWSCLFTMDEDICACLLQQKRADLIYPPRIAIALDLLLRSGWIQAKEGRLMPEPEHLREWTNRTDQDWTAFVYRLWMEAFTPVSPLARTIAYLIPYLSEDRWLNEEQVLAWWDRIRSLLPDMAESSASDLWQEELAALQAAGWIETGKTAGGQFVFRRCGASSPPSERDKSLYVQSDMELMLDARSDYALHYLLMGFSELQQHDRMRLYRLNPKSVKQAYVRGWTAASIIKLLERHAVYDVPDSVRTALVQWERDVNLYQTEPVIAVRFRTPQAAEEMAAIPQLASLLTEDRRLNATTYMLSQHEEEQFQAVMKKLGLLEGEGGKSREPGDDDIRLSFMNIIPHPTESIHAGDMKAAAAKTKPGLFYSPFQINAYERVQLQLRKEELYPGIGEVPAMWLKEGRAYHASTKAAICEQAIRWNCYLEVSYQQNTIKLMPTRLTAEEPVTLHGYCDGRPFSAQLSELPKLRILLIAPASG